MSEANHEGVVVIINSHAKGNFKRIRKITDFLNKYDLYAAINSEVNPDLPPVLIEVHIFNPKKRYIVPQLENFIKISEMSDIAKITVIDKDDMPTFMDMAKGLGTALFSTGKKLASNAIKPQTKTNIFVTDEQKAERLSICADCPYFNHRQKRCLKCGCKMRFKTALKVATCPMDKWPTFD
jgi:hypothetical protein